MITYTYQCEFGHLYEESQSIKDFDKNRVVVCAECGNIMESYIGEPPFCFPKNITTVGQLGEKNWRELGKCRQQEKMGENKEKKEQAKRQILKDNGLENVSIPDYQKSVKLGKLNKQQQDRYIKTGKLPP